MSLYAQPLLDVHDELIVDLFAGGGGASSGIEQALGRPVDIAINHDAAAVALHTANHPQTVHHVSDVFEVNPRIATGGRKVGLLWMSPDCTGFSKAKGAAPRREKDRKRRALAWVGLWWAGTVRPRVIALENVEEFLRWTRLVGRPDNLRECKKTAGRRFKRFVRLLREMGYAVEWRELRACDYGAPTIRKRLFVIARCDGQPIVWPVQTHGAPGSEGVKSGRLQPWRKAAGCIDWSLPMCSIFATREEARAWGKKYGLGTPQRPLADNSCKRIARGVSRFVLKNPSPYFIAVAHAETGVNGSKRWGRSERDLDQPLTTIVGKGETAVVSPVLVDTSHSKTTGRGPNTWAAEEPLRSITSRPGFGVVAPMFVPRYGERNGQAPRSRSVEEPSPTIVPDGNGASVVAVSLHTNNNSRDPHYGADEPTNTVVADGARHTVVGAFMAQHNGGFYDVGEKGAGRPLDEPISTVMGKGCNQAVVGAFFDTNQNGWDNRSGRSIEEPAATVVAVGPRDSVIAAHIQRDFGTSTGHPLSAPLGTITADGGGKAALVGAFLQKYYGNGTGQSPGDPLHTIPTLDRFGLVTVKLTRKTKIPTSWGSVIVLEAGEYTLADICMRMLWPHELYACQGFRPGYIINCQVNGKWLSKAQQVLMVGNSVSPPVAEAIARANCPEMIARKELRAS